MNKYRSLVAVSDLEEGDIIHFKTQGTLIERTKNPWSYGYVHHIEYDTRKNDDILKLRVLPLLSSEDAKKTEFRHYNLDYSAVGNVLGLDPNKTWAAILSPVTVEPKAEHLGRNDGCVQRMGKITGTIGQSELLEHIANLGGDEKIISDAIGAPRLATSSQVFGLYIPVGVKSNKKFEETEYVKPEPKKRKTKPGQEGKVLDIDLEKAITNIGLDKNIVALFEAPHDKRVKPLTSLRAIFELVSKQPEDLGKYIPENPELKEPVLLADLMDSEIHRAVVNGFATPRPGSNVLPVVDLKAAYDLVTLDPNSMSKYSYLGPKFSQVAVEDITEAYRSRVPDFNADEVTFAVKTAWKTLTQAYLESRTTQNVPAQFQDENQQPVWKLVPAVG